MRRLIKNRIDAIKRYALIGQQFTAKRDLMKNEMEKMMDAPSMVANVVRVINSNKVLVKLDNEEEYVVECEYGIDKKELSPDTRVALDEKSKIIHKILPRASNPKLTKLIVETISDTTFDMIGGLESQIKEVKEVIEISNDEKEAFAAFGLAPPKCVLLHGPPGTGKTLIARAVAHHTQSTFIKVNGSDLVQKYIGEGARLLREVFQMVKTHSPSIIFFDKIDSIGYRRSAAGDSKVERTMIELLNQLDGFDQLENVKVIMATNRLDILDEALVRSGRIDRKIEIPEPNEKGREAILKIHTRKMNLSENFNFNEIAKLMQNTNAAEVKGVCTEAGMCAIRGKRIQVTEHDFKESVQSVGKQQKDVSISVLQMFK